MRPIESDNLLEVEIIFKKSFLRGQKSDGVYSASRTLQKYSSFTAKANQKSDIERQLLEHQFVDRTPPCIISIRPKECITSKRWEIKMNQHEIDILRALMDYEAARTAPPENFPILPDIPAGRYTNPKFFDLERQHIWGKSWLFAAHIDEIPEPGTFMTWEQANQPVLIVHTEEEEIKAFYNVCSHRGAPVVREPRGKRLRLTCSYHGWSYSLDGDLKAIKDPQDFGDFDFSCRNLKGIRCERFGNLIFVNFDHSAVPLLEWLGPIATEWEEFQFDKCRLSARYSFDLNCNWKIAMEANTEVYHVPSVHPATVAPLLDHRRNVNTLYPGGHGRMVAPPPRKNTNEDSKSSRDVGARKEIETVSEIARTCIQSYGIFPNWVSQLTEFVLAPLLFWPNGINKSRLECWTLAPDWGEGDGPDYWTINRGESLCQILLEDTELGSQIQRSMESGGFTGVPLSYQEARIYHWNQHADHIIGIDQIPAELRVKQVIGEEWIHPHDPRLKHLPH